MLLLINCKSIYGTDVPEMTSVLKRMGHEVVVFGGPDDLARGEILRAESVMAVDRTMISEFDTTESRRSAMTSMIEKTRMAEALVVSDDPRDRAAAYSLNLVTVSPFDFNFQWVGEEAE